MHSHRITHLLLVIALAFSSLVGGTSQANAPQGYSTISPPRSSDTKPDKIEVLEFFSYSCSHCAKMEALLDTWAKTAPKDVVLKRIPVAFNAHMKPMQQLYFTLMAMGRTDLHIKIFDAIHTKGEHLFTRNAMGVWAAHQGLDRTKFDLTFDSFSVQLDVQRANQLAQIFHMEGTPSFVVGGKFLTSPAMAGNSYEGALKEIDALIAMSRI